MKKYYYIHIHTERKKNIAKENGKPRELKPT